MSDIDAGAAVAAPDSTAIASEQTAEVVKNDWASVERTIDTVSDKLHPPRGDGGKFAPKAPLAADPPEVAKTDEPVKTEITDQTQTQASTEPPKAAIDAPVSWSAEMKAKWSSLPPEVQAYAAQREGEAHKRISELGQQVKTFEPIREVIEHFAGTFQRNGLQPHDAIARMMAVEKMLDENPRSAIEQIAQAYGVNLSNAQGGDAPSGEQSDYIRSLEARVARAEKLASEVHSKTTARERSEFEREQAELASRIEKFSKDKPHFEAVRKVMAGLMQSGAAETLEDAYEQATFANKSIRESIEAERRKADETKAAEEAKKKAEAAKKAASMNVRSSNASPAKRGSWEQTVDAVAERLSA